MARTGGTSTTNFAKPFDRFLEEAPSQAWFQRSVAPRGKFAGEAAAVRPKRPGRPARRRPSRFARHGTRLRRKPKTSPAYKSRSEPSWPAEKIAEYNRQLDGKILIPQPFGGKLKNNYEKESGFAISKFMVLELVVAVVLIADLLAAGQPVATATGQGPPVEYVRGVPAVHPRRDCPPGDRPSRRRPLRAAAVDDLHVRPRLNLLGMLPWMGSPTASFSVTLAMAAVTFVTVVVAGSLRFGIVGFWKNQVPSMGLPWHWRSDRADVVRDRGAGSVH